MDRLPSNQNSTNFPPVTKPETYKLRHVLKCQLSGLYIGDVEIITTAGTLPYLSHWNDMVARHPVFSMGPGKLLTFTTNEWHRLGKKVADDDISDKESDILRVCYLALLHSLDCIKQDKDVHCLPPIHIVYSTLPKLLKLAFWKHFLESQRFRFPTYHISRINTNADFSEINAYLNLCFEIKADYETKVNEKVEKEKLRAAEEALKALNREWVIPPSKKVLFKWVVAHLPSKYYPDVEGWLGTLFMGGTQVICQFDKGDLDLLEEIIVSECPPGTGIMQAVRGRLSTIRKIWEQQHEAFEIDLSDFTENAGVLVNGAPVAITDPGHEPGPGDFSNRAKYLVAHAKWKIAKSAWDKQQATQQTETI